MRPKPRCRVHRPRGHGGRDHRESLCACHEPERSFGGKIWTVPMESPRRENLDLRTTFLFRDCADRSRVVRAHGPRQMAADCSLYTLTAAGHSRRTRDTKFHSGSKLGRVVAVNRARIVYEAPRVTAKPGESVVTSTCGHNCGGRCAVNAHVRDGQIVKISTDPRRWTPEMPPLHACVRGFGQAERVNHPAEAEIFAVKQTYGAKAEYKSAGREPIDYVNSRLIVMWGWSPGDGTFGTGTMQYLKRAKHHGARIVSVDPRVTRSSRQLAD